MNRLLARGLFTNSRSLIQPVRPGLRQLASPVNVQRITIARRSSEEVPEHEGGSIQKVSVEKNSRQLVTLVCRAQLL